MNVLHLITGLGTGGAEAMLYKLISYSADPSRQAVVSLTRGGKHRELLEQLGVSVYELNLKQFWMFPFRFFQLLKLLKKHRIQVINAWMYHAVFVATLVSFFSQDKSIKLIWNIRHSLHDLSREKLALRIIIRLLGRMLGLPAKVIFNSRKSAAEHSKYWAMQSKEQFVPNGFDIDIWKPRESHENQLKAKLGIGDGQLIGHVGRHHPMKNHVGLIRCFEQLAQNQPDVHLVLIGKGTETLEVEDQSIKSRIHIMGERQDVQQLMPDFDCFVLCSNWGEGFPNVLGEAMACALPCITTDVGDSAFLLSNQEWILPPYDESALTNKLKQLLVFDERQKAALGDENRKRIEAHFTMQAVSEYYEQLYAGNFSDKMSVNNAVSK